jgi:hypothetical protein
MPYFDIPVGPVSPVYQVADRLEETATALRVM